MCDEAACISPQSSEFVPERFKTQEMCNEAVRRRPHTLDYVSDHFRMQEMENEDIYRCDICVILKAIQYHLMLLRQGRG